MTGINKRIAIAAFAAALLFGANIQSVAAQNGNYALSGLRMAANESGQRYNERHQKPPHEMRDPDGGQRPDFNNRGDRPDHRPDFNRGDRPDRRPGFNKGDRGEHRPDFNRGDHPDRRPDFNRGERGEHRPDFHKGDRPDRRPDFNRGDRPGRPGRDGKFDHPDRRPDQRSDSGFFHRQGKSKFGGPRHDFDKRAHNRWSR